MKSTISTSSLPRIDRAGQFPLLNPLIEFTYRNPTCALHLYDYPGLIRIGAKEYQFSPGDISCIQSGTVYSYATESPGKHWCIHYYDDLGPEAKHVEIPCYFQLGINSHYFLEQIRHITRLHYSYKRTEESNTIELEANFRLKALLLSLYNFSRAKPTSRRSPKNFSWDQLITWIDENIDQSLSLSTIAQIANVAPGTLSKYFKNHLQNDPESVPAASTNRQGKIFTRHNDAHHL